MSTEQENNLSSVFEGGNKPKETATSDPKDAKIAELERELQKNRVENGRLAKANEHIRDLEGKLSEYQKREAEKSTIADLPQDLKESLPEDYLKALGTVGAKISREAEARQKAESERYASEVAAIRKQAFGERVERNHPGFIAEVADGGKLHDAWVKYQRFNRDSIVNAFNACDYDTLAYHIGRFCDEVGVQFPSGGREETAAADPRALGGGGNGAETQKPAGKVYTSEEYVKLYDELERARDRGDFAEMKRIDSEIKKAPAEGRVK